MMKSKYISPILQMFLEERGTANALARIPDAYVRKNSLQSELEDKFKEKHKSFPETIKLHDEIIAELCADLFAENDFYYSEGFRFGVLLGLDIAGFIKEE